MLTKLLTGILSCSKKICGAAATFVVRAARFMADLAQRTLGLLTEGWNWLGTTMKKPAVTEDSSSTKKSSFSIVKDMVKAVLLQRLVLFIGGIICVFVLPSDMTNNDLTWFENMLTSVKSMIGNTVYAAKQRVVDAVRSRFSVEGGYMT